MAFDIHGNNLQPGHCEVHPFVHQQYPCYLCLSEAREAPRQIFIPAQYQEQTHSETHDTLLVGYDEHGALVWMKTYNFNDPSQEAQGRHDIHYVSHSFPRYLVSHISLVKLAEESDKSEEE